MNIDDLRNYCLAKPHTTEDTPFGESTLVFRVGGKIYALTSLDSINKSINLKCNPERAIDFREQYSENILPGYHMNKKHWNTVLIDGLEDYLINEMIDHSYNLVFNSLPKSIKTNLGS